MPLAQATSGDLFFWCLVLVGLIVAAFVGLVWLKKWLAQQETTMSEQPFTLSDLREFHKQGKMTTEEYEKAKAAMLELAKKQSQRQPPPSQ